MKLPNLQANQLISKTGIKSIQLKKIELEQIVDCGTERTTVN